MASTVVEQTYHYLTPSECVIGPAGDRLRLATSGGVQATPRFFDGWVGQPRQNAAALLCVARVARMRFGPDLTLLTARMRAADPVVTSNHDRLRFESFSTCAGVYARLDLLPSALEGQFLSAGTTNVDFNHPMRTALAGVGRHVRMALTVGPDQVALGTPGSRVVERKVPLATRWLKSFAEVQLAQSGLELIHEMDQVEAVRFLRSLPASSSRSWDAWVLPAGKGLRLRSRDDGAGVKVAGLTRLRALVDLAPYANCLRLYGPAKGSGTTVWELALDGARFHLAISPEPIRGFSGEGNVLSHLADERAAVNAEHVREALGWRPLLDVRELSLATELPPPRVEAALAVLGSWGLVGYDLALGGYFHRELPFDMSKVDGMHPRLKSAKKLHRSNAVTFVREPGLPLEARVRSGDVVHRVRFLDFGPRCTCPWYAKHRSERGPCKHLLAAEMALRQQAS
jgi:hypothetical protein